MVESDHKTFQFFQNYQHNHQVFIDVNVALTELNAKPLQSKSKQAET